MSEYNSQLCDRLHEKLDEDVEALKKTVNGNGKTGVAAKVDTLWKWYEAQNKTRAGLLDWAFRAIITIGITYIAVKVGLK